eukprot:m.213413 g.213413  ORF g.213413 m.213413 type:complete len:616 (+) comp33149_c0_seq1:201-2048(+)
MNVGIAPTQSHDPTCTPGTPISNTPTTSSQEDVVYVSSDDLGRQVRVEKVYIAESQLQFEADVPSVVLEKPCPSNSIVVGFLHVPEHVLQNPLAISNKDLQTSKLQDVVPNTQAVPHNTAYDRLLPSQLEQIGLEQAHQTITKTIDSSPQQLSQPQPQPQSQRKLAHSLSANDLELSLATKPPPPIRSQSHSDYDIVTPHNLIGLHAYIPTSTTPKGMSSPASPFPTTTPTATTTTAIPTKSITSPHSKIVANHRPSSAISTSCDKHPQTSNAKSGLVCTCMRPLSPTHTPRQIKSQNVDLVQQPQPQQSHPQKQQQLGDYTYVTYTKPINTLDSDGQTGSQSSTLLSTSSELSSDLYDVIETDTLNAQSIALDRAKNTTNTVLQTPLHATPILIRRNSDSFRQTMADDNKDVDDHHGNDDDHIQIPLFDGESWGDAVVKLKEHLTKDQSHSPRQFRHPLQRTSKITCIPQPPTTQSEIPSHITHSFDTVTKSRTSFHPNTCERLQQQSRASSRRHSEPKLLIQHLKQQLQRPPSPATSERSPSRRMSSSLKPKNWKTFFQKSLKKRSLSLDSSGRDFNHDDDHDHVHPHRVSESLLIDQLIQLETCGSLTLPSS